MSFNMDLKKLIDLKNSNIEELAELIQHQASAAMVPVIQKPRYCECDQSYYGATTKGDGARVCNHCKKERR